MSLFGVGKSAPHTDPALGELSRRRGRWEGRIAPAPHGEVPLLVAGGRDAPNPPALALARELPARYPGLRAAIAQALWEHYEPYRDAGESPRLDGPAQVWDHVALVRVLVEPLSGVDTVELAYDTDWDEEHMLGARFQGWALIELNGSVI